MPDYASRIRRIQEELRADGLGGAVFAPTAQMRYLSGFAESGHERLLALFVPAEGEPAFVVPEINAEQTRANPAGIDRVFGWGDSGGWYDAVQDLLSDWCLDGRGLAIDDELMSVHLLALQRLVPRSPCVAAGALMARLREVKTADEIAALARSASVTDAVYEETLPYLREGVTERDIQDTVAQAYKRRGTRPEFAIVCFGPHTALPHHSPGSRRLGRGDLVILDIGCIVDDYYSDITRTVAYGPPDAEAVSVYQIVLAAHQAAYRRIAPGVTGAAVDSAARDVISEAGYGAYFIHRTGHGIGLSGHEPPYIVAGNGAPLKAGMCFSDEPGIYLPGRFGVRIENIVAVTPEGARYLNAAPPEELVVVQ